MVDVRDVRVVIFHQCALLAEQADHIHRGRLAHIVNVGLVGRAQHEHATALEENAAVIHRVQHAADHVARHVGVDLGGQFDEARAVVERLHLPREVQRINRDAVTAEAGAGRELHETERFAGGRVNHLPHVHAEALAHDRQFVDHADVDHAEGVLQQFRHLRGFGR